MKNKYEGATMKQLKLELAISIVFAILSAVMMVMGIVMAIRQQENFDRAIETIESGKHTAQVALRCLMR